MYIRQTGPSEAFRQALLVRNVPGGVQAGPLVWDVIEEHIRKVLRLDVRRQGQ